MKSAPLFAAAAAALLHTACLPGSPEPEEPKVWNENTPAYYSYTFENFREGDSGSINPVFVTSSAHFVLSAYRIQNGDTLWITSRLEAFSINTLLNLIAAPGPDASVTVQNDPIYGFPADVLIKYPSPYFKGLRYRIRDFRPLSGPPQRNVSLEMKAKWAAAAPARFTYKLRWTCFCDAGPFRVTAIGDSVESAWRLTSTGADSVPVTLRLQDFSFDSLTAMIDESVENDADEGWVSYDSARGFPRRAYIDYRFEMADEEMGFEITDFAPLAP